MGALAVITINSNANPNDQFVQKLQKKYKIPALAYAVYQDGNLKEIAAYGLIHNKAKQNVTINSRFHLGSNTKAYTALIAAWLVEQGKISWETTPFELFPEWRSNAREEYLDITLADLLSHRAQVQPFTSGLEFDQLLDLKCKPIDIRRQVSAVILSYKPVTLPKGAQYVYSNAGYCIAASMLEKVSNKSWEELVEEVATILKISPGIGWPNQKDPNQPWGHLKSLWQLQPTPPDHPYMLPAFIDPAGDLNMSMTDFATWMSYFVDGISGKDNIIKSSSYKYLTESRPEYAMGWGNVINNGLQIFAHDGSAGTFHTRIIIYKDQRLGIAIMANTPVEVSTPCFDKVTQYLSKKYLSPPKI